VGMRAEGTLAEHAFVVKPPLALVEKMGSSGFQAVPMC